MGICLFYSLWYAYRDQFVVLKCNIWWEWTGQKFDLWGLILSNYAVLAYRLLFCGMINFCCNVASSEWILWVLLFMKVLCLALIYSVSVICFCFEMLFWHIILCFICKFVIFPCTWGSSWITPAPHQKHDNIKTVTSHSENINFISFFSSCEPCDKILQLKCHIYFFFFFFLHFQIDLFLSVCVSNFKV